MVSSLFFPAYNLAWSAALPLLALSSRLRQGWRERVFASRLRRRGDLWIQASSAGEAYLACQLLRQCPDLQGKTALVTCSTTQGLEVIRKTVRSGALGSKGCRVESGYFPFDMPLIMDKALGAVHPKVMVILETELWPGLLGQCKKRDIPVILLNGRLSERSYRRYMKFPSLWRSHAPNKIMAVSEEDARRFKMLYPGIAVDVMKNMKFDRVLLNSAMTGYAPGAGVVQDLKRSLLVVFASIRKEEESDVLEAIKKLRARAAQASIALFPRHMHRKKAWIKLLRSAGIDFVLRSKINTMNRRGQLILWDVFGELVLVYNVAAAVFVGGTLRPCGGQNFLEPLGSGLVPCIGPYWENFSWVGREIVERGLVTEVRDVSELVDALVRDLHMRRPREAVLKDAAHYIKERQGGTKQACREIVKWL